MALALGIGANTAIFSVIHGMYLRPLPYPAGERLVEVHNVYPKMGLDNAGTSIPDYLDRRSQAPSLEDLAMYTGASFNLAEGGAQPERQQRDRHQPDGNREVCRQAIQTRRDVLRLIETQLQLDALGELLLELLGRGEDALAQGLVKLPGQPPARVETDAGGVEGQGRRVHGDDPLENQQPKLDC